MIEFKQESGPHHVRLVLVASLLFIAAIWGGTTLVYAAGTSEFERISPVVVAAVCLVVSLGLTAVGWLIFYVSGWLRFRGPAVAILVWSASFAAVASLLAPLPVGVGMTDLAQYGLSLPNLSISLAIATMATAVLHTPLARIAIWGAVAFSLSSLVQTGSILLTSRHTAPTAMQLADQGNILVISFDGLQRDVFQEAMAANPNLLNRLNEFTLFTNVVSSSPATQASTAAEVLGNMNFKAVAETTDELVALAAKDGIPAKLAGAGYRVAGYGVYSAYVRSEGNLGPLLVGGNGVGETTLLLQNAASRVVGPQIASNSVIEPALIALARLVSPLAGGQTSQIDRQIEANYGPNWDRYLLRSRNDLTSYENRLTVGANTPAAHFLHFTFTHHPVDFDEHCQFRSTDKEWFDSSQNRNGLLGEAVCSIVLFEEVLQRLDDLGILDTSLVVIKSDHGAPIPWNDPNDLAGQRIRNNATWGYGRYMPILLIRSPGKSTGGLATDPRPVMLDDLAGTICMWANLPDCERYAGANLLDPADTGPEEIWVNVVRSAGADFRYDTHTSVQLERTDDPLANLYTHMIDETLAPLDCKPGYAHVADLPLSTWRIKDAQMLRLTTRGCTDLTLFLRSDTGLQAALSADVAEDFETSVSTARVKSQARTASDGRMTSDVALAPADHWTFAGLATAQPTVTLNKIMMISPELLLSGWHQPEPWGVWSAEPVASLRVEFDEGVTPRELSFAGQVYIPNGKPTRLEALLNGTVVADLMLDTQSARVNTRASIPPAIFAANRSAVLAFRLSEIHSPSEFGGADVRNLGFGLEQLSFR